MSTSPTDNDDDAHTNGDVGDNGNSNSNSNSNDDANQKQQTTRHRRRNDIIELQRKLRSTNKNNNNNNNKDENGNGYSDGHHRADNNDTNAGRLINSSSSTNTTNKDGDDDDDNGITIITSSIIETLIVPAMKDILKQQDDKQQRSKEKDARISGGGSSSIDEKKDGEESSENNNNTNDGNDDDDNDTEYTIAILECLVSFVVNTPSTTSNQQQRRSSTTKGNGSLSFRSSSSSSSSSSKSNTKEIKTFVVTCGVYEMMMHLLRQILDDHCHQASSKSWTTAKSDGLDSDIGIGIDFDYLDDGADAGCDLQIKSTLPTNNIPILIMEVVALLAHNGSDAMKNDRLLPHLSSIIHTSMMVYLPCPDIQYYGCWILYSLSNPLLQELIAAGSFSLVVQAMKCHPTHGHIQEYGNKTLYNLLPLLVLCYKNSSPKHNNNNNNNNNNKNNNTKNNNGKDQQIVGAIVGRPKSATIEIDGKQLEDYESLLPSLPVIVLRGMEYHPARLGVQQYGLLVLMRLCQHDQEQYEVIVSEGGLTALLQIIAMTTTITVDTDTPDSYASMTNSRSSDDSNADANTNTNQMNNIHHDHEDDDEDDDDPRSRAEKYDSLAQMACQFLRDLSRPTNSSMDILRIIAVKGGIQTVLQLLHHYNTNHTTTTTVTTTTNNVINIIDPAMACLRNLMVHEDNRAEAITKSLSISTKKAGNGIIQVVLHTMDLFREDAAIQAYGCDLLGRLAINEELARIELIQTTIMNVHTSNDIYAHAHSPSKAKSLISAAAISGLASVEGINSTPPTRSRLWNRNNSNGTTTTADEDKDMDSTMVLSPSNNSNSDIDEEIIDMSDQFHNNTAIIETITSMDSMYSGSMNGSNNGDDDDENDHGRSSSTDVDSFMTLIRTMKTHRTHCGVQDRAVVLLLALVIDKENNSNKNSSNATDHVNSSSYLIQRLQEVYDIQLVQQQQQQQQDTTTTVTTATITTTKQQQQRQDEKPDFLSFLKSTTVSSKGIDRLKKLITIVEQYERMKRKHTNQSSSSIASSGSDTGTGTTNSNGWFRGKYINRLRQHNQK